MMQKKRYQIFLSSTFSDLEEERRKVMQTLLEMDCIPSGMEFFPASDEETFEFIKTVIDDSDYYILILAGRYGSVAKDGTSYTEKEYDYAASIGKPILSFVRKDLSQITFSKMDTDISLKAKLDQFRAKVLDSGRLSRMWDNADQLAGQVSTTLNTAIKRYPTPGWIRGDQTPSNEILSEINELRKENQQLKSEAQKPKPPLQIGNLANFDSIYKIDYTYEKRGYGTRNSSIEMTWRDISIAFLQNLTKGQTIITMETYFRSYIRENIVDQSNISINDSNMRQIVIQLELLGLLYSEQKKSTEGKFLEFFFRTDAGKILVYENLAVRAKEDNL